MRPYRQKESRGINLYELAKHKKRIGKNFIGGSSKNHGLIFILWFTVSFFSGHLANSLFHPPQSILAFFSEYEKFTSNYNLVCHITAFSIYYMPFAFILFWKRGYEIVVLNFKTRLIFILVVPLTFILFFIPGGCLSFSILSNPGTGSKENFIRELLLLMDWFGISLYNFTSLYMIVFGITTALNNGKGIDK